MPRAKKRKNKIKNFVKKKRSFYSSAALVFILGIGLMATVFVAQQNQDTRGRAYVDDMDEEDGIANEGEISPECVLYMQIKEQGRNYYVERPEECELPEEKPKSLPERFTDFLKKLLGIE